MTKYSLGSDDPEIARLDLQAASLDAATRLLLRSAGIRAGMRVLDLGTGLGHVAFTAAEAVGEQGRVVGLDNAPRLLEVASGRTSALPHVTFVEGDVRTWQSDEPFDAIVGRLVLFTSPTPSRCCGITSPRCGRAVWCSRSTSTWARSAPNRPCRCGPRR